VYEKEHLLIDGPGKYPDYNFYKQSGIAVGNKGKGEGDQESPPVDVKGLMP
jgi:NADH-quinone oxidoreductase subunit I